MNSSVAAPQKTESFNVNKYLASGVKGNAISIQDYVKQLNGSGIVKIWKIIIKIKIFPVTKRCL